jgi:hypothetical protein
MSWTPRLHCVATLRGGRMSQRLTLILTLIGGGRMSQREGGQAVPILCLALHRRLLFAGSADGRVFAWRLEDAAPLGVIQVAPRGREKDRQVWLMA